MGYIRDIVGYTGEDIMQISPRFVAIKLFFWAPIFSLKQCDWMMDGSKCLRKKWFGAALKWKSHKVVKFLFFFGIQCSSSDFGEGVLNVESVEPTELP